MDYGLCGVAATPRGLEAVQSDQPKLPRTWLGQFNPTTLRHASNEQARSTLEVGHLEEGDFTEGLMVQKTRDRKYCGWGARNSIHYSMTKM